jgi:hypothetical protein
VSARELAWRLTGALVTAALLMDVGVMAARPNAGVGLADGGQRPAAVVSLALVWQVRDAPTHPVPGPRLLRPATAADQASGR